MPLSNKTNEQYCSTMVALGLNKTPRLIAH